MKITYVIGQLTVSGTELQLLELIRHLDPSQYQVTVISLYDQAPLADNLRALGCTVRLLAREKRSRVAVFLDMFRELKNNRPDVVHGFAFAARPAMIIAKLLGIKGRVVSIRTFRPWKYRFLAWLDQIILNLADTVLCNSYAAYHELSASITLKQTTSQVIYNGLDLQRFDQQFQQRPAGAPPVVLDDEHPLTICCVGTLAPVKNHDILLRAFKRVLATYPTAQLWLVGGGPNDQALTDLTRALELADHVVFWGQRTDVPSILRYVDLGVLASSREGMPNAVIEYLAAGLPVVATDVGGIRELVDSDAIGLLVPPNDMAALADALLVLLADRDRARRMGQRGRAKVEAEFAVEGMVSHMETIYRTLLESE